MLKKVSLFIDRKFQNTADAESIRNAQHRAYEISGEILLASCGMNVRDLHKRSQALDGYSRDDNDNIFEDDFVSICRLAVRLEILIGISHDGLTTIDVTLFGKKAESLLKLHRLIFRDGDIL